MAQNYRHTLFDDAVKALQERHGSRASYARMDTGADGAPDTLTPREIAFIEERDSFYMASVNREGWPYMQHRGGPAGFLRHIAGNLSASPTFAATSNISAPPTSRATTACRCS